MMILKAKLTSALRNKFLFPSRNFLSKVGNFHPSPSKWSAYRYKRMTVIILVVWMLYYINGLILQLEISSSQLHAKWTMFSYVRFTHDRNSTCTTPENGTKSQVSYYKLSENHDYHYEFRYELQNFESPIENPRLILLLTGRRRKCVDWWDFSVGHRILSPMRSSGYSLLAICSKRLSYDINMPIQKNLDVKWIYLSLQIWINEVYYRQFQRYPRIYLYGVCRGAQFGSLLSRVLPVQAQIITADSGDRESMLIRSDYDMGMGTRLIVDPMFANWFYFNFCYSARNKSTVDGQCPFRNQHTMNYFNAVPPTYFVHLVHDHRTYVPNTTRLIFDMRRDAFHLGGALLAHTDALKLYVAHPLNFTPSYMKETFIRWSCKSSFSKLFYEHFTRSATQDKTFHSKFPTCWCANTSFTYFEQFPNITRAWSRQKQEEYYDYVKDVEKFRGQLCEDFCGDLMGYHSMTSRHIEETLSWLTDMDRSRYSLRIEDFLSRPLRVWMYDKYSLGSNEKYLTYQTAKKKSCGREYMAHQMYSPEYFLQDYFRRLNVSRSLSLHNLVWATNPLLADYFIIPHDYICITGHDYRPTMPNAEFKSLYVRSSRYYLLPLLNNIRTAFPYWNMTSGSNHIIAFTAGFNMGRVQNTEIVNILKNVVQLGFSGCREDLLSLNSPPLCFFVKRNVTTIYRHNYDVVIPPFNKLQLIAKKLVDSDMKKWYEKKKILFFFAGTVNNSNSVESGRMRLALLAKDVGEGKRYNSSMMIEGKQFVTMVVNDGHISPDTYAESIRSTVFNLCPEGFSPWSPRLYESICLGAIPFILADGIVLPFERFVDWHLFTAKLNVSHVRNMLDFATRTDTFEEYVKQKLKNATPQLKTFLWPYSAVDNEHVEHVFLPEEDLNGTAQNVFHYISVELRCRRLEQMYGLTSDSFSMESIKAQRQACKNHPTICPCHNEQHRLAFEEYL